MKIISHPCTFYVKGLTDDVIRCYYVTPDGLVVMKSIYKKEKEK